LKTLIIDEVHPVLLQKLSFLDITYLPQINAADVASAMAETEILIVRSKLHISAEHINAAPQLKLIGRLGSGMDNIDLETAEKKGIVCVNAPEGNRDAVAEQTIGMLLSLLHNVTRASQEVRNYIWDRKANSGTELGALTVGIIGYGNVGTTLAKKLNSFGCKVLCYDKYKVEYGDQYAKETSLDDLLQASDVISLHTPLNASSYQMVDADFLAKVKDGVYLLNLSRGEVVVTKDLVAAIRSQKIAGCALDVLENEKLETLTNEQKKDFEFLTHHKDVIVTPHIGGLTHNSYKRLAEILAEKIGKWCNSLPLVN
jgi:D-3-phosphoglycerate dehydrogenase